MTFIRENAELLMALWIEQTLCRLCPAVAGGIGPADLVGNLDIPPEQMAGLEQAGVVCWKAGSVLLEESVYARVTEGVRQVFAGLAGLPGEEGARKAPASRERPFWDPDSGELRLGGRLVRRVARNAINLRKVLQAFQDAGWERMVKNPFGEGTKAYNARLRAATRELSMNQEEACVAFAVCERGSHACWEIV